MQNNVPLFKEDNTDNQFNKSIKSIKNLIYNEIISTLAICYDDNSVILQSFGSQKSERMVC